ncbi:hypothetical protein F4859DRAFT_511537 [Xylaria cf. heliscus]|nr:hypothetical protein F4859DRAFT_511537 [Xylaria cf. heliscus]
MERIKRIFISKKNKNKSRYKKQISSPVEGSFHILSAESNSIAAYPLRPSSHRQHSNDSNVDHATIAFVPRDRGREATIEWLHAGTSESLVALLTEKDHAAHEIRRGPKTKGTREVQRILSKPSRKTVEKLHRVREQAEMAVRYGAPGVVVYNFSRSWGWNLSSGARMPSLQLRRDPRANRVVPAVPFSPINWLVLPNLGTIVTQRPQDRVSDCGYDERVMGEWARSSSPISEPGGWRDTEQMDDSNSRLDLARATPLRGEERDSVSGEEHGEDEGEYDPYNTIDVPVTPPECQATAITMIPACGQDIREVKLGTT